MRYANMFNPLHLTLFCPNLDLKISCGEQCCLVVWGVSTARIWCTILAIFYFWVYSGETRMSVLAVCVKFVCCWSDRVLLRGRDIYLLCYEASPKLLGLFYKKFHNCIIFDFVIQWIVFFKTVLHFLAPLKPSTRWCLTVLTCHINSTCHKVPLWFMHVHYAKLTKV
jgi:hypothetical protein